MRRLAVVVAVVLLVAPVCFAQREPDAIERALADMAKRAHEREMQKRQQQHEMEMQRRFAAREQEQTQPAGSLVFERTGLLFNGRSWASWPPPLKTLYVIGAYESITSNPAATGAASMLATRATYAEIVAGLDDMFADPSMRVVPVALVLPIFAAKSRGAMPSEVEAMKATALASVQP